jgi:competence protein ComEA
VTRLILTLALLLVCAPSRAETLDLNTATAEALEALPGVGPAKARAIVADREKNGPFASVDELDRVRGFGVKAIERLKPHLAVGAPTARDARQPPATSRPATPAWDPELDALDKEAPEGKVNLNTADEAALKAINGLSAQQAKVIVAIRRGKGPFRHLGELARVPGLTPKLLDTMKYFVTVRIDASRATAEELAACGILPDDARAFVKGREAKGKLKKAADLGKLAGLSPEGRRELEHWLWFP